MNVAETVRDVKSLRIQGATNIAVACLRSLKDSVLKDRSKNIQDLKKDLVKINNKFISARPTEPFLRNGLTFALLSKEKEIHKYKSNILNNINLFLKNININRQLITKFGYEFVPRGGAVFTHCHSSTVMDILKFAHTSKKFVVHNTEARPLFQGRISAKELASHNIRVFHYPDSAARLALKDSDVMLIGCDAITKKKIINKIGSELFAETANKLGVPVYVCTDALKFDPATLHGKEELIEMRNPKEVWNTKHKSIEVLNYAFEKIDPKLVKGIVSELGVHTHKQFLKQITLNYPWIKNKKFT